MRQYVLNCTQLPVSNRSARSSRAGHSVVTDASRTVGSCKKTSLNAAPAGDCVVIAQGGVRARLASAAVIMPCMWLKVYIPSSSCCTVKSSQPTEPASAGGQKNMYYCSKMRLCEFRSDDKGLAVAGFGLL